MALRKTTQSNDTHVFLSFAGLGMPRCVEDAIEDNHRDHLGFSSKSLDEHQGGQAASPDQSY